MSALSDLLREILQTAEAGLTNQPGRSVVVPGALAAWDDCCAGQLSLRVVSIEPRGTSRPAGPCSHAWTLRLGLQIVRCIAVVDDLGQAPTASQITADGMSMADDALELHKALVCAVSQLPGVSALEITSWTPSGAQGGCAGGEWQFRVAWLGCGC